MINYPYGVHVAFVTEAITTPSRSQTTTSVNKGPNCVVGKRYRTIVWAYCSWIKAAERALLHSKLWAILTQNISYTPTVSVQSPRASLMVLDSHKEKENEAQTVASGGRRKRRRVVCKRTTVYEESQTDLLKMRTIFHDMDLRKFGKNRPVRVPRIAKEKKLSHRAYMVEGRGQSLWDRRNKRCNAS